MACGGQQLIEYSAVGRCPVGAHLAWVEAVLQSADEEPASSCQISLLGDHDVDDLAILVNRPVQLDPSPGDYVGDLAKLIMMFGLIEAVEHVLEQLSASGLVLGLRVVVLALQDGAELDGGLEGSVALTKCPAGLAVAVL